MLCPYSQLKRSNRTCKQCRTELCMYIYVEKKKILLELPSLVFMSLV